LTAEINLPKKWSVAPKNTTQVDSLSKKFGLSPLMTQLLLNRQMASEEIINSFLNVSLDDLIDPFSFKDMDRAVVRIHRALRYQEPITIYGDYDADGVTSVVCLYLFLKNLGARVEYYIPSRFKEGYGLSNQAIDKIKSRMGKGLVITVDNGISSIKESQYLYENNLDLIIIDHHQIDQTPRAEAIIHPLQSGCNSQFKNYAAVGLVFNLLQALRRFLFQQNFFQDRNPPNLKKYLDLVALGTIADMVPLRGQNRILAKFGLIELSKSQRPGIVALKEITNLREDALTAGQVSFRLAPRINAAGRMAEANLAVELLISDNAETANQIALHLDDYNKKRQDAERLIVEDAMAIIEKNAHWLEGHSLVMASSKWHQGIVGIAASKLVDKFYLPTVLISEEDELGRGSARGIKGIDLYKGLSQCSDLLIKFGGHEIAAGLSIKMEMFQQFRQSFDLTISTQIKRQEMVPSLEIDALVKLEDLSMDRMDELARLEPHGVGNRNPLVMVKGVKVGDIYNLNNNHLKFSLFQEQENRQRAITIDGIGFSMGNRKTAITNSRAMVFSPQINTWKGNKKVQLILKDFQ